MLSRSNESGVAVPVILAIIGGLVFAMFTGAAVGNAEYFKLILTGGAILGTIWLIVGIRFWWLPVFFLVPLGGFFYFGFRIYVHELAVLMSLVPLVGAIILAKGKVAGRVSSYETIAFLLLLYLAGHLVGNVVWARSQGIGGMGNIVRRYADALWPLILLIPILLYANFRQVKIALWLILIATLIRFAIGTYGVFIARTENIFIPIINYMPPAGGTFSDLRSTGAGLLAISVVFAALSKGQIARATFILLSIAGFLATFFGSGRLALVSAFILVALACMLFRQWFLIIAAGGILSVLVLLINANPDSLYEFHPTARRALSGFILDKTASEQVGDTGISNRWHERLEEEGYKVWSNSFASMVVGEGIRPFEQRAWSAELTGSMHFDSMAEMAAATKRFERTFWNVLASFGAIGLGLYLICFLQILSTLFPRLMRERIISVEHGLAFIALYNCVSSVLLIYVSGDYPSYPIFLGFVAMMALKERDARLAEEAALADDPPPVHARPLFRTAA